MTALTMRDFRSNLATSFDRVDKGERIYIRRNRKLYTIVSVEDDDLEITPTLAAKIEQARKEHREGKTLKFESSLAAQKWLDEL